MPKSVKVHGLELMELSNGIFGCEVEGKFYLLVGEMDGHYRIALKATAPTIPRYRYIAKANTLEEAADHLLDGSIDSPELSWH